MGSLGCPLCCQQDFVSVVALHDHLLYYVYRPLQCGVCCAYVGGIQGLTRHLERHMGDGMPNSLHAHRIKSIVSVLADSGPDIRAEDQDRAKGKVATTDEANNSFCSLPTRTNIGSHVTSEEPIELILRAYFCQTCGAKVVGKDAYILHIKQHSVVPGTKKSETFFTPVESCPQVLSPAGQSETDALSSNLASDASTPGIFTTDTETVPVNDSEDPSEHLSDYIEETDTANQLLKLREWQLEKLGKSYRRHKISFGRSPAVSEMSPTSGKLTCNSSPSTIIDPGSVERRPQNQNYSPYTSVRSNITYSCSVGRSDSYIPQSSGDGDSYPVERSSSCNPSPSLDRESVDIDPCHLRKPDSLTPLPSTDGESVNIESCSTERPDFVHPQPSSQSKFVDIDHCAKEQSSSSFVTVNSTAETVCDSIQISSDCSKFGSDTVRSDEIITSHQQVTAPSSVLQHQVELMESVPQTVHKFSPRIERDISLYQCLDKSSAQECLPSSPNLPGNLGHFVGTFDHESPPQLESIHSPALNSPFISSHHSLPDLELQTFSKPKSSITLLNRNYCTSESVAENSKVLDSAFNGKHINEQLSFQKSQGSSQSVEVEKSSYKDAKSHYEHSDIQETTKLLDYNSCNQVLRTSFGGNETNTIPSQELKGMEISSEERTPYKISNITENRQHMKLPTEVACEKNPSNFDDAAKHHTDSSTLVNYPSVGHNTDSIETNCAESVPYLHKKFHHDQERKVIITPGVGQGADVNRFIHNFQSLLVSRLNGTLGTEMPFRSSEICSDTNANKKREISPMNQSLKIQQQPQSKEYICEVCTLKCTNRSLYKSHYKTHEVEGQKNFSCQFCGQKYFKKCSKDLHERKHTGKKVHRCGQCSKVFTKVFSYLRHQREVHAVKRAFICAECSKGFSTQRRLKEHIGIHQSEKAYKCVQCNHSCYTASGLRTHMLEIHSETQNRFHSCEICGEKFSKQYGLKRHKERKHLRQQLSCEVCSKVFSCNEDRLQHAKSHMNNEPFKCDHCEKIFSTSWALQRHSKSHQATTHQFQCSKCPITFTRKDSLISHLKIHAQKRAFICHCGKRFVKKSQLKEHEDKHSKIQKYSCDLCKHSFKFRVSLRNHSCKRNVPSVITAHNEQN